MQPQLIYIDTATGLPRAQTTGYAPPSIHATLGTTLVISAAFAVAGVPAAIASYTADSLRLVIKPANEPDAEDSLFPVGTWVAAGSGAAVRYTWTGLADSVQLEALIGRQTEITLRAQIEWRISTDTNPIKSLPFDLIVINSPARLDDGAPDVAGAAAKLWLIDQLAEGTNITFDVDAVTKVITINADFSAAAGAMIYKGAINASTNPNYPAATQGETWAISVAGKIGGASGVVVEIGDVIVCKTTAVTGNHATVGTSWTILQSNISGITSDGLALMQAGSTSIQRGLLGLQIGLDVQAYSAPLSHYGNRSTGANLAALTGVPADFIELTGAVSSGYASSIGTAAPGLIKTLKFTSAVTLYHDATTFILPTGANIVTASGDIATFRSTNGSTPSWICTAYQRVGGAALVGSTLTLASQAEAEAGTENTKAMTALRTAQAIAELAGSGGSVRVTASGVLQGYTTAPVVLASPPPLVFDFSNSSHVSGDITVDVSGSALTVYFADSDPSTTPWVDTSGFSTWADLVGALESELLAHFSTAINTVVDSNILTVGCNASGASATITSTEAFADVTVSGGGSGVNAVAGSGHITEVILIPKVTGKIIKPERLFASGAGIDINVAFALKTTAGAYHALCENVPAGEVYCEPLIGGNFTKWLTGLGGADLIAYYSGTTPTGGGLTCIAFAEQY